LETSARPTLNYVSKPRRRRLTLTQVSTRIGWVFLLWIGVVFFTLVYLGELSDKFFLSYLAIFLISLETFILGGLLLFLLLAPVLLNRGPHTTRERREFYGSDPQLFRTSDILPIHRPLLDYWTRQWQGLGFQMLSDVGFTPALSNASQLQTVLRLMTIPNSSVLLLIRASPPRLPPLWPSGAEITSTEGLALITWLSDGAVLITQCPNQPLDVEWPDAHIHNADWPLADTSTFIEAHQKNLSSHLSQQSAVQAALIPEQSAIITRLESIIRQFFEHQRNL
jgi:hypothetical protein